jgi:16S rRNA (guanine527-N7)-methyltransferase
MKNFDLQSWMTENELPAMPGVCDRMVRLLELLTEVNARHNLTRIISPDDYWIKHVVDSLYILKYFPELAADKLTLVDIGCGAGFPSIPLAAFCPNLQIIAMDSIGKKTSFVQMAADKLGFTNLRAVTARARELNRKEPWRDRFDIITARAVAPARMLYRETKAMRRSDGRFIFYKTPEQVNEDLSQVSSDSASQGLIWDTTEVYQLPGGAGERQFLYSGFKS